MKFLYIHFPKAGGTSLKEQLEKKFPDAIMYDYANDPIEGEEARLPSSGPCDKIGIVGHLHPEKYYRWSDILFTVLRDPIDNLISIFYFWKSFKHPTNPIHKKFMSEKPSLIEFSEKFPVKHLMSRVYFGDFDMDRFDFIGFHENREDSLKKLSKLLGVELNPHHHSNKTLYTPDEISEIRCDRNLISNIREVMKEDCDFYEKLLDKWG